MSKVIVKNVYGNVCIPKAYCIDCRDSVFIISGSYSCCGKKFEDLDDTEKIKRIVDAEGKRRHIKNSLKKEILQHQKYICIYCECDLNVSHIYRRDKCKFVKLSIHFDHFEPWCYGGNSHKSNLYASCNICNVIKSDKHFVNIESARIFINEKRKEKGI